MAKNRKENVVSLIPDKDIDDATYQALLLSGDILPRTGNEVAFVKEHGNLTDAELPESLLSPQDIVTKVVKRKGDKKLQFGNNLYSESDVDAIAHAARDGGEITEETEILMKEARDKVDKDLDDF